MPTFEVRPKEALAGEPIHVVASGCRPGATVAIRGMRRDARGVTWMSQASFVVGNDGEVDASRDAPTAGTYTGVDPFGLLWSMRPPAGAPKEPFDRGVDLFFDTEFELVIDGDVKARDGVRHQLLTNGVQRIDVRERGLHGTFFTPAASGPRPTILIVGGSEGGLHEGSAALLASHGFATLALAYFGIADLPSVLVEIPLEYFETALQWLQGRPEVDPECIGVMGGSKGGELALLLAATFPTIRLVVADAPSGVVWQGFDYTARPPRSSWTYKGEPLPCIPFSFGWKGLVALLSHRLFRKPMEARASFSGFDEDASLLETATIPVEKINGPVLLLSGGDDRMWSAVELAQIVVDRLERSAFAHRCEHVSYPDAGHAVLGIPSTPTFATDVTTRFVLGGTPEANARAHMDAWPRVLAFFREHFLRP